jgi:hypothetical protein
VEVLTAILTVRNEPRVPSHSSGRSLNPLNSLLFSIKMTNAKKRPGTRYPVAAQLHHLQSTGKCSSSSRSSSSSNSSSSSSSNSSNNNNSNNNTETAVCVSDYRSVLRARVCINIYMYVYVCICMYMYVYVCIYV